MCGIAGAVHLKGAVIPDVTRSMAAMNRLIRHRGPDGDGTWVHPGGRVGLTHRRLAIIDLVSGDQPMHHRSGTTVTYNGEIYNYVELREELGESAFETTSDTECILRGYERWGQECVDHLRGMFAFALWDEPTRTLFCARDRFGIKPFYYTVRDGVLYFASEIKALLPFVESIETDTEGLADYLTFQFCLAGKTLFKGIQELLPGHTLTVRDGEVRTRRYWEVYYHLDFDHTEKHFVERIRDLLTDSVRVHLRADVPIGAYVSGGLDSSTVASLASDHQGFVGFTGKFAGRAYDESHYARAIAQWRGFDLHEIEIGPGDFVANAEKLVYHLDFPVAGPGSFPQLLVSELARRHRKVVLGGQGGDEIFGGYTRYLVAYFEQCIKAAIDGTSHNGNFVVTYESIIPNLGALRQYKPMLQEFWREGLFDDLDRRYFRLVNRAPTLGDEVNWAALDGYSPYDSFREIFRGENVGRESYFDSMTHFDFKTLLPALLQVEDRVSMAHSLESRVPLLDHPLVELAATVPSNVKFKDGEMKHVFKKAVQPYLPDEVFNRTDKMGFPVPLVDWMRQPGPVRDFVIDTLSTQAARGRDLIDNGKVVSGIGQEAQFGRKLWGLLCLELWQQRFHDRASEFRNLVSKELVTQ